MKKLLIIVLSLALMLVAFAGCEKDNDTDKPAKTDAPAMDTNEEATDEVSQTIEVEPNTLPISESPIELTVWQSFSNTLIDSMEENPVVPVIEEMTGITLKFKHPAVGEEATAFQLMISSQEFPDIIRMDKENSGGSGIVYPGGGEKAVKDGVFLQLNDLIAQYAPNYLDVRARGGVYEKDTITDSGVIWAMYSVSEQTEPAYSGLVYRKDLADAAGLDEPVTLDDWHEILTLYKEEYNMDAPLMVSHEGLLYNSEFLSAWGIGKDFYQVDGEVKYGYIQPEFKEYLTMMNQWYQEGLLDQNFATNADFVDIFLPVNYAATDRVGSGITTWSEVYDGLHILFFATENEDINFSPVHPPVLKEGDTTQFRFMTSAILQPWSITSSCEHPVEAVKFLDWCYTEEGSLLVNYGIEGDTYSMVDGKPRFSDWILYNEDGYDAPTMFTANSWEGCPGLRDYSRGYQNVDPHLLSATEVWDSAEHGYVLPSGLSLTSDEAKSKTRIMADIETYIFETIPKFITGDESLDGFDAFVDQIMAMGIEDAIEIEQAAFERYQNR